MAEWGIGVQPDRIPKALKRTHRWVTWKVSHIPGRKKPTKVPYQPNAPKLKASTTYKKHWAPFDDAWHSFQANEFDGIGLVLTDSKRVVGIDLDNVIDNNDVIAPWAMELIDALDTYTEVSPSGTGVRMFAFKDPDSIVKEFANHDVGIEVYTGRQARFLTVTGNTLKGDTLARISQSALAELENQYAPRDTKLEVVTEPQPEAGLIDYEDLRQYIRRLPVQYRAVLKGRHIDRWASRSEALFALICALMRTRATNEEVFNVLVQEDWPLEVALDHRNQNSDKAEKYLWHETLRARAAKAGGQAVASAEDFDVDSTGDILWGSAAEIAPLDGRVISMLPGALKHAYDYVISISPYPQPIFAIAASIVACSGAMGRGFMTQNIYANVYLIALGVTGSGKEAANKGIKDLLMASELGRYLITGAGSGAGIEDFLMANGQCILALDELGEMFAHMRANNQSADHGITRTLLQMYSSVGSVYTGRVLKGGDRTHIEHPFLSMLGVSTPKRFIQAMTKMDAENGWLGRPIILESHQKRPVFTQPNPSIEARDKFADWAAPLAFFKDDDDPMDLPLSPKVEHLRNELIAKIDKSLSEEDLSDILRVPRVRVVENVTKLALIAAVARDADRIEETDWVWAETLGCWAADNVERQMVPHIRSTSLDEHCQDVLDVIKDCRNMKWSRFDRYLKRGVIPKSAMRQKFLHLSTSLFEDILQTLSDAHLIVHATHKPTRGPKSTLYCAVSDPNAIKALKSMRGE